MAYGFLEGIIRYPDTLPCPQVETDLVPRERRYISDIMDVRNMRMFQQEFQATRNKIYFVFTEEEAREFREWYEEVLYFGGAWFYADWPTLDKEKDIGHRFVGQPRWEWLLGANPGGMGRSTVGGGSTDAVTMYKVTATVEVYDPRKVGKNRGIFTSKLYPLVVVEDAKLTQFSTDASEPPNYSYVDDADLQAHIIIAAEYKEQLLTTTFEDDAKILPHQIMSGWWTEKLLTYNIEDEATILPHKIMSGEWTSRLISYSYYEDDATLQSHVIVGAEWGQ